MAGGHVARVRFPAPRHHMQQYTITLIGLVIILIAASVLYTFVIIKLPQKTVMEEEITMQPQPLEFGFYEVCADLGNCIPEEGIQKIVRAGGNAVLVSVTENFIEDNKSVAFFASRYLPKAENIPQDYLPRIIRAAHDNNIKVYAWINMPHEYWLNKHPKWISILSDGRSSDYYDPNNYFSRIIPPVRVLNEPEYLEMIRGLIFELASLGVDGIDLNDNFQWAQWYFEDKDKTLFSSYDSFTIDSFERDTGIAIPSTSPKKHAAYIEGDDSIRSQWNEWKSQQVTSLLSQIQAYVDEAGDDIPFRPHLLYGDFVFQDFGLKYDKIASTVDVMYVMLSSQNTLTEQGIRSVADTVRGARAKSIAVSLYINDENKDDISVLGQRIGWLTREGIHNIYLHNFATIDQYGLWDTVQQTFTTNQDINIL